MSDIMAAELMVAAYIEPLLDDMASVAK